MRAMNLEDIETGGVRAGGGLSPVLDDFMDFVTAQCARDRVLVMAGFCTWRNQFPIFPVLDFRLWR